MKREIKFRGKKVDLGGTKDTSFVYGFLSNTEFINDKFGNGHCVDYKTIGQFTGLKDKNGLDIYEGDLIRLFNNYNGYFHVIFTNEYVGGWVLLYDDKKLSLGVRKSEDIEVIGNIYENPELLTVNN